ncbi:hypothetical protein [Methylobacterium sp. NFXW15]|uniref:hypothetical protein n=1 Tax=Methylobacterium sp. NFXW15 TaxID=2819512 RepID=UPI003CF0475A
MSLTHLSPVRMSPGSMKTTPAAVSAPQSHRRTVESELGASSAFLIRVHGPLYEDADSLRPRRDASRLAAPPILNPVSPTLRANDLLSDLGLLAVRFDPSCHVVRRQTDFDFHGPTLACF